MIPEVNPYNNYRGDGVATLFDYDFYIQNGSQLIVEHIDENDVVTRLEENIDYEIVVIEDEFAGYIKFPIEDSKFGILQENETLSLQLTLPFEQISEYGQSSLLDLNSIEFSYDYLTRLCQILKRQMERSVKVNEGSEATPEQLLETINNNAIVSTNAATIASKKADEAMESANIAANASEEINNKIAGFNESFEEMVDEITQEGEKQLQNVQSTGFYMRDDKLYFINSEGEEEEFKSGGGGAGAVMFDTKISDHILTGEEAKGWALQGTYVSGALYPDFYNKCLEEYKNSSKSWNGSNVSLVGSVTDNQGVLSGFSSTSYAEMTSYYQGTINSLEFVTCVTIGAIGVQQNIFGQTKTNQATFQLQMLTSGKIELLASSVGSSSWDVGLQTLNAVTTGSTYWIKTTFNNATGYEFYLSENGVDYDLQASNATTTAPKWTEAYQIGNDVAHTTNAFKGTIDLKESYIDVNGSRYWTGANTIAQNPNGHKFYPIAEKSAIDSVYNQYGIADFYGIDEENVRVFLPRNKYFQQLTDDISKVNEMVEAGLPNITGQFNTSALANAPAITGAFKSNGTYTGNGGSSHTNNKVGFDASRSSSIYGNSDTVQPPSSVKLLYYCVGNTEVTSAITNVTEVTTSENDTIPLFAGMYFDFKPNNVSWLKAGEQQKNAGIYKTCYDTLVQIVNGVNNFDLKVINQADMVSGVIYDEYWVLDQNNMTFRTPLTISLKAYDALAPVVGNGMTLGMTNGTNNFGTFLANSYGMYGDTNAYGKNVGSGASESRLETRTAGVTTDPTKSGIEAHLVENTNAQLYFKVANAVQNLELLDAGEVLEAVNNVIPKNSELIASYGMPDYSAGVSKTNGTTHAAEIDGWLLAHGGGGGAGNSGLDGSATVTINGTIKYIMQGINLEGKVYHSHFIPLPKGTTYLGTTSGTNPKLTLTFYPSKGAK